jgi:hypothetical protein
MKARIFSITNQQAEYRFEKLGGRYPQKGAGLANNRFTRAAPGCEKCRNEAAISSFLTEIARANSVLDPLRDVSFEEALRESPDCGMSRS